MSFNDNDNRQSSFDQYSYYPQQQYSDPYSRSYDPYNYDNRHPPSSNYDYDRYSRYDRHDRYSQPSYYDSRSRFKRDFSPSRRRKTIIKGTEEERLTTCCLYVGNLPYSFHEREMTELFERYGKIKSSSVPLDKFTQRNKGFAFIEFEDRLDAEDALAKLHNFQVDGRRLKLDWDVGQSKKDQIKVSTNVHREHYSEKSPEPVASRSQDDDYYESRRGRSSSPRRRRRSSPELENEDKNVEIVQDHSREFSEE